MGFKGYIVSDCGGVADLANKRYPADPGCIANQHGAIHNNDSDACFFSFLAKGACHLAPLSTVSTALSRMGGGHACAQGAAFSWPRWTSADVVLR